MNSKKLFKILMTLSVIILAVFLLSACDQSFIDVYTQINPDFSGIRTVDIAVKTEYLQKGQVAMGRDESLFEKIFAALPPGEIETRENNGYTHFVSTIAFEDINFLKHVSIDGFSEEPPKRFYAKMEREDFFFKSDYVFEDFIDMHVDEAILQRDGRDSDFGRLDNLIYFDADLLAITYQIRFPVKITDSNADMIGENNIAIWNIRYGEQKNIWIEGSRTKFLSYFMLVVLGLVILFVLFLIIILLLNSRRPRRPKKDTKPLYSYDNYFKRNKDFD